YRSPDGTFSRPFASRPIGCTGDCTSIAGMRTATGFEAGIASTTSGEGGGAGGVCDVAVVPDGADFSDCGADPVLEVDGPVEGVAPFVMVVAGGAGGGPTCWVAAQAIVPPPARSSPALTATTARRVRERPGCSLRIGDQRVARRRLTTRPRPPRPRASPPRASAPAYSVPAVLVPPVSTPPCGMAIWAGSSEPQAAGAVASSGRLSSSSD